MVKDNSKKLLSEIDAELLKIKNEVLDLKNSPLYKYRKENNYFPVIGEGSHEAKIMFVGEAPGRNEAESGRPFCGSAGKVLDELLSSIGLDRKDIYITNIIKDRPEKNRDPIPKEIMIYGPFLDRQIDLIKPEVIVALGRYAMLYIMNKYGREAFSVPISSAHGNEYAGTTSYGDVKLVALYHPCVAIYDRKKIGILLSDFKVLEKYK